LKPKVLKFLLADYQVGGRASHPWKTSGGESCDENQSSNFCFLYASWWSGPHWHWLQTRRQQLRNDILQFSFDLGGRRYRSRNLGVWKKKVMMKLCKNVGQKKAALLDDRVKEKHVEG